MYIFLYIFTVVFLLLGNSITLTQEVTLVENQLFVNGKLYDIRGICWSPCGIGDNFGNKFSDWYEIDLLMIAEMNANTIRTYVPIKDVNILDAIYQNGLRIIMGFTAADTIQDLTYINRYKNHDAILMWCFGNEFNYHPEWFGGDVQNWYRKLNNLAEKVSKIDTNHPVTTAHGELPDSVALTMCPNVQLWGVNTYRWDNLFYIFEDWSNWSKKPIWISESGIDSYHTEFLDPTSGYESETNQDSAAQKIWWRVFTNLSSIDPQKQCLGITFFEFNDEWWKAGEPDFQNIGQSSPPGMPYDNFFNEEYFGFVKIDRTPKQIYYRFQKDWSLVNINARNTKHISDLNSYIIHQNYPNPFNEGTQIKITLNKSEKLKLTVYNILGKKIVTLCDQYLKQGEYEFNFISQNLNTGIYFYRLEYGKLLITRKMLCLK
jgi:hypothetical protein